MQIRQNTEFILFYKQYLIFYIIHSKAWTFQKYADWYHSHKLIKSKGVHGN